jgi:hypothetical protein
MARILVHPQRVARYGDHYALGTRWRWWRCRLLPDECNELLYQFYDDPVQPREASVIFNRDDPVEFVDPPAVVITVLYPEFQDINYGSARAVTSMMTRGPSAECDLVWHQCPGPRWMPLPGDTCQLGEYRIESMDPSSRRPRHSTQMLRHPYLPVLPAPEVTSSLEEATALTRQQIAAMYGVPLAVVAPDQLAPSSSLDGYLDAMLRGVEEFRANQMRNPTIVLINLEDYRRIVELARQRAELLSFMGNPPQDLIGDRLTVFGLEVRAERLIPRGQVLLIGEGGRTTVTVRPDYAPGGVRPRRMPPSARVRAKSSLYLNPEDQVLDDIDLLVNEQVRGGPVDDYRVDRYPKCKHCPHQWHGLCCEHCDCLGELEEEV